MTSSFLLRSIVVMLELWTFFHFSFLLVDQFNLDEVSFGTEAMKMAPTQRVQVKMNSNLTTQGEKLSLSYHFSFQELDPILGWINTRASLFVVLKLVMIFVMLYNVHFISQSNQTQAILVTFDFIIYKIKSKNLFHTVQVSILKGHYDYIK